MNFQSLHFFVFFLVVLTFNLALRDRFSARKNMLLVASYYFYMCWDWRFAGLILLVTVVNYVAGAHIAGAKSARERKLWLFGALAICLGVLAYFKYLDFFVASAVQLLGLLGIHPDVATLNIVLPIGISFFTFQSLSYVLDVYRGVEQPCRSPRDFALFVAFFPTLLAGPITRARQFLPQLTTERKIEAEQAEIGLALMLRGFIKKIALADVLAAHLVNPAFADPSQFSPWFLLLAAYGYSFQIYMDFSGYTDIARGMAKMLGFELIENFNRPYLANSVSNFWQRWHISMSSFFRDYLFFGLGGSKNGNVYFNLMVTFVAIGFWHDDGWNFIVYGITHGLVVCFERLRRNRRERMGLVALPEQGWHWFWRVVLTFHIVALSRVLFRANDLSAAASYYADLFNFSQTNTPLSLMAVITLLASLTLHYLPQRWAGGALSRFRVLPVWLQGAVISLAVYGLMALATGKPAFVYFQF
jgi:alginate O-acetyltransferase complex protein AlgI